MRKPLFRVGATILFAPPSGAANWQDTAQLDFRDSAASVRPGAFVGARFTTSLGQRSTSRAQLSISPTQSPIAGPGRVNTRFGGGLALNFGPKSKPTLTLAGIPADAMFGLKPQGAAGSKQKRGLATGGGGGLGGGGERLAWLGPRRSGWLHSAFTSEKPKKARTD